MRRIKIPNTTKALASLLTTLLVLCGACIPPKDRALALMAIDQYHDRFNAYKFEEIYIDSSEEFKTAISKEEFVQSITAMREGEGRVLESEQVSTDYQSAPENVKIKLLMAVTFEKSKAREEFVYQILEGKAILAGYKFLGR